MNAAKTTVIQTDIHRYGLMELLGVLLGAVMSVCYGATQNYGLAIILFTLFTKAILLPLSVWLHKNGIKIVKLQARINGVKADYYGDGAAIAEKQSELYKQAHYHPLLNLVPIGIQLILLMGLVEVIYHPLTYLLHLDTGIISQLTDAAVSLRGLTVASNSIQIGRAHV